ncbi:MAG: secretin N-terminal domain-containing protein, partial [Pseudomonadota bacterium]
MRNLVQRLDRPGTAGVGGSGIHVVYLKNADAVKLAQILRASFPGGGGAAGGGAASGGAASGSVPAGAMPSTAAANTAAGGASSQSTAPVGGSAQPSTGGFIQADPSSNSLIITASDALYKQLRAVIDQLDGRRAQIYIESMIVKVDAEKAAQMGVQWAGAKDTGSGGRNLLVGGLNASKANLAEIISTKTLPGGLSLGLGHKLVDGTFSMAALATFLETEGGANILSTPNMVALDNEEAKIVIGQNVPFVTGSYSNTGASTGGSVSPFQT